MEPDAAFLKFERLETSESHQRIRNVIPILTVSKFTKVRFFSFFEECEDPKACTILLRGANKDVLNETERNLADAMSVARNVLMDARLVPGGGAIEMAISQALMVKSNSIQGVQQWTYRAIANALEVIPRTLAENCGAKVIRVLTELRVSIILQPNIRIKAITCCNENQ